MCRKDAPFILGNVIIIFMHITIYTDGSSRGNPGPGGWGAILITEHKKQEVSSTKYGEIQNTEDEVIEIGGRDNMTTNNRMELMATIKGLKEIQGASSKKQGVSENTNSLITNNKLPITVEVNTDSQYVKKGITEWIDGWIKNNWRTSAKKDVLNKDLWQELKAEVDRLKDAGVKVAFKYVAGHSGIPLNERADVIATTLADNLNIELYRGARSDYTV